MAWPTVTRPAFSLRRPATGCSGASAQGVVRYIGRHAPRRLNQMSGALPLAYCQAMRVSRLYLYATALLPQLAGGQALRVDSSTFVARSLSNRPLIEPHLAIDPVRPQRILAAAFSQRDTRLPYPQGLNEQNCSAFLSEDSGRTWIKHDFDATACFDPWVAITPDGSALVTVVARHHAFPQQGDGGLLAYRSADGGVTWDSVPLGLGRNHDHTTLAIDVSQGPRRGWIYVSSHRGRSGDDGRYRYGLYLARSRNSGRSFDDPVWVIPNNLHNLAEMPVVLSDGTLIASFVDASYTPDSTSGRSRETLFERRRAWVVRSTDGGISFSVPLFVTDACGPPPGYRLSAFAADVSRGANDGSLYFACRAAGRGPIVVTHSRDRGETWSPVVRMSTTERDSVAYPIPGLGVNDQGHVLVAWTGGSESPARGCETDLYASVSTNGGQRFSPAVRVATCAGGGDYFGVVGVPGGRFRLLWSETRDGEQQLRTALLTVLP